MKTKFIAFRTDMKLKAELEKFAQEKEWSLSHAIEYILKQFIEQQRQ